MDLQVTRLCSSCGSPIEFAAGLLSLCPECRERASDLPSSGESMREVFDADRPPWTLGLAGFVLGFFMLSVWFIPSVALVVWAQVNRIVLTPESILNDPKANLIGVAATAGSHLLTFLVAWTVVTGWNRRFTDVVDWSWHPQFKLRHAVATVVILYGLTWLLDFFVPSGKTYFDKLLELSLSIRVAISVLAVVTAPFIEELVYRGVLYPAVQAKFGRVVAIFTVGGIFALVHFPQYSESLLVLVSLTLLSFVLTGVRAYTRRLLPCYAIHLFYNVVGVTLIFVDQGLVH